jgi:hypothetical protein
MRYIKSPDGHPPTLDDRLVEEMSQGLQLSNGCNKDVQCRFTINVVLSNDKQCKNNIQTHGNVLGMFFAMFILQKSAKIKQYVAIF